MSTIAHYTEAPNARLTRRSMWNVAWNLVGGGWTGVLVILATPWYVSRLGLEGYGVVSLWLLMQVLMGLLDVGMGASLTREFADGHSDLIALRRKQDLLRTFETLYWVGALVVITLLLVSAPWLSTRWLKIQTMPSPLLIAALRVMAIGLAVQFPIGLYTAVLAGLQKHGQMNLLQVGANTLRYGCGAGLLLFSTDLRWFFAVQASIALLQAVTTRHIVWRMVAVPSQVPPSFNTGLVRQIWRFSAGMALTSVAAVFMANADRLILSKISTAELLGKYAIAFTATGLVQLAIQPFYRAYYPRYSELVRAGDSSRLRYEYYQSCRVFGSIIIPVGIIGGVFAPVLFEAWLGQTDPTVLRTFRCLLIGITCSGLMWLPAALQQATGWTRLHIAMMAGALVAGAPIILLLYKEHGVVAATAIWVAHGTSEITIGLWLMHRRLFVGQLWQWYRIVLIPPLLTCLPIVAASWWSMPVGLSRWAGATWAGATVLLAIGVGLLIAQTRNRQVPETITT